MCIYKSHLISLFSVLPFLSEYWDGVFSELKIRKKYFIYIIYSISIKVRKRVKGFVLD